MTQAALWWIACGALVAVELFTLTLYLLMLALGAAAGAIAAHLGAPLTAQMAVAAFMGALALAGGYWWRHRHGGSDVPASADPNVNLDVGGIVQIEQWNDDGTASVRYRGATWTAAPRAGAAQQSGAYRVAEVVGARLLVEPV